MYNVEFTAEELEYLYVAIPVALGNKTATDAWSKISVAFHLAKRDHDERR